MSTLTVARERRGPDPIPPAVRAQLQAGKLEQACACGRWEAAHRYCSKCLARKGPADWYPNGDMARRLAVVGDARAAEEARPKASRRGPRNPQTPVKRHPDADDGVPAPDDGDGTLFGLVGDGR